MLRFTPGCKNASMTDAWTQAAQARRDFADMIDGLSPEQINAPTLCEGWTAHHVAAHLVTFVDVPLPKFIFNVAKAKGNFDVAANKMAQRIADRPVTDLVATLRAKANKKAALPMFPGELTMVDTMVHTQDVRRALDLSGDLPTDAVRASLEFLTTSKRAVVLLEHKGLLDGLRLESTDSDWSYGEGQLVSGTNEALLLGILRRPVFEELNGDGVATLRQRQRG
ncbi:MAG: hypothetical protein ACI9N0_001231 [Ilumatobacter sp.]